MNNVFSATRHTDGLLEETGYWSGDIVCFNLNPKLFIITHPSLKLDDISELIRDYIHEQDTESGLTRFEREVFSDIDNETFPFPSFFSINSKIRNTYSLKLIADKACRRFYNDKHAKISWQQYAHWLEQQASTAYEQKRLFSHFVYHTYNSDCPSSEFAHIRGLRLLHHPWLKYNLAKWIQQGKTLEDIISLFADTVTNPDLYISRSIVTFTPEFYDKLTSVTHGNITLPDPYKPNNNHGRVWYRFRLSIQMLLGILCARGFLMFPPDYAVSECWSGNDIMRSRVNRLWPEDWKWARVDHKTLAYRLVSSSTIRSLNDIPENIRDIIASFSTSYRKYTHPLFTKRLKQFQAQECLPSFPLVQLHGLRARRNKTPRRWSYEWCEQELELTPAWLDFARIIRENRSHTVEREQGLLRNTLEWAWLKRRFSSPADIRTTDLRDPATPGNPLTLFSFVKSKNSQHFDIWCRVAMAFRTVACAGGLERDPFEFLDNPFKSRSRKGGATTSRHRIPNNIHAAMLNILLSPDEDGYPTYSLAKSILKNDWIYRVNPDTLQRERVFCPSRVNLLALLLILPLRKKQASWLDQGLMDSFIWDLHQNAYVPNDHPLKDTRYPSGKNHYAFNGRPTGVFQPITNDWFAEKVRCIYINTNKTQMWDPDNQRGYELWWPTGEDLKPDIDIADLTQQKNYLKKPYDILENQIRWVQKWDPSPEPVTFTDWSDEKIISQGDHDPEYPYFTPVFRDLASPNYRNNGKAYFVPPNKIKLRYLLNAIAFHTEKQLKAEYGVDVVLTREKTSELSGSSYKHRVCIYDVHSFRVYGISYLMEIGVPWPVVQMIVGHVTPVMTLYYNKMTSGFIRKSLSSQMRKQNFLTTFNEIADDIFKNNPKFITRNIRPGYTGDTDESQEYRGFVSRPGGICPVGGLECHRGQVSIINDSVQYTHTNGRCGNCRYFCTTPAHLFAHQQIINDLFIQVRSLGKKQIAIANDIKALHFEQEGSFEQQSRLQMLTDQQESLENETEPLIREWMNRREMATQSAALLSPYIEYLKSHGLTGQGNHMLLVSPGSKDELESRIEFHFLKAGEFELVRQTMLGAYFSGGIQQCSELSRYQMRDFLNSIMAHDNPRHLLFNIPDEKARDNVAFLMAEALVSFAGTESVQNALDNKSGLKQSISGAQDYHHLEKYLDDTFSKAITQGATFSIEALLPGLLTSPPQKDKPC